MSNKTSDKNVANIEELINLEEQLEIANDRIKELEEELAEFNKQLDLDYVDENYIPKQVVIDTMEELNNEIKNGDTIEAIFKIKQQQILQELLEGER